MTSGIPTYDTSRAFLRAFAASPHRRFTPRQLVAYAKAGQPTHGYSYSNTNYILGEMIITRVTHDSYGHQLRTRIIRPLHLYNLTSGPTCTRPSVTRREPAGYFFNREIPDLSRLLGRDVSRDDSLVDTRRRRHHQHHPRHDRLGTGAVRRTAAATPPTRELRSLVSSKTGKPIKHTTPSDPQGFGLGIAQLTHPELGRFWFYEGETLGFRAVHAYFPDSGLIIAFGLNSATESANDQIATLMKSVYDTLLAGGLVRLVQPRAANMTSLFGTAAAEARRGAGVCPTLGRSVTWSRSTRAGEEGVDKEPKQVQDLPGI